MPIRLTLENWTTHRSLDLETIRPIAIVTGRNAVGKTALLDALEFALLGTGKLRGIRTKTDLGALSISDGALETAVHLEIPDAGISISRRMTADGQQEVEIGGTPVKISKADAAILALFDAEPDQLRAVLEAEHLLVGDEKARRQILFRAAGTAATLSEVLGALTERGLEGEDAEKLARQAATESFAEARAGAEAERAACSRLLRESLPDQPAARVTPPGSSREVGLDQITVRMLEGRRDDLRRMLGEAQESAGVDRGRLAQALETARARRDRIVAEGEKLAEAPDLLADSEGSEEAAAKAVVLADRAVEKAQKALTAIRREQAAMDGAIERPDVCPAIPGGFACPVTQPRLAKHRGKLEQRRGAMPAAIEVVEGDLRTAEEAQRQAMAVEQRAREALRSEEKRAAALARLHTDLDVAEQDLEAAERACGEAALDPAPTVENASVETPGSVAFVRKRLANCEALLAQKTQYDRDVVSWRKASEGRRSAEEQRAWWDRAAKALAPDGIPSRLFAARTAGLQASLDVFAAIAPMRLTSEAEIEAEVDGRWRRYAQLSESWRLRLSIAATHLLATAAGFPILVVDRFDHIDPPGRARLLECLRAVARQYSGGVLVLATLSRPEPSAAPYADVETLWLHDGALDRVA